MKQRLVIALIVAFVCACAAVHAGAPTVLARVERHAADDLSALRAAGLPVVMEKSSCLFLRGSAEELEQARKLGWPAQVIDAGADVSDYYVVGLRPDSDRAALERTGTLVWAEENWIVLRVPPGVRTETLGEAKVFLRRMPATPIDAPRPQASLVLPGRAPLAADPLVQKMVAAVSPASIDQLWLDVTTNSPTGTRYTTSQGCRDATAYCFNKYGSYKVPAAYQEWSTGNAPNVVATQEGALNPGNVYIVIGHLDDLPSAGAAPGADDNASGSVNVLESARVMSCWAFRNTVKYVNCTGEETGLNGSEAYANDAATRGENILGVINMDMPGWAGDGIPNPENLDVNYDANSQDLGQRFATAATTYGTGLAVDAFLCPSLDASDHYPFWTHGWKAICGITDNEGYCSHGGNYPYYHTSNDTIANCGNKSFFYSAVRTSVATLAELAQPFKVALDRTVYGCAGVPVAITLGDRDLNTNSGVAETVTVSLSSTTEPTPELVTLTEKNLDSMIFKGALPTTSGPAVHGDGLLSVSPGDTITVAYTDALDCDGSANVPYTASAGIDCVAPSISNVQSSGVTGSQATITWTTNELATSVVHYGTAPPGASTSSNTALVTAHTVPLRGLAECTHYYYWVESADAAGNTVADTNGGAYYTFDTGKNVNPSYASTDTPLAIPDNNAAGATSTIAVSDTNTVLDVNVVVNITHSYDGDIALYLVGPNGTQVTLSNRHGSSGDNYTNTVFDDAATTAIADGTAPFTGTFKPDAPLSVLNGIPATGNWQLKVVDSAGSDTGTILGWTLQLTYPAGACGPGAAYQSSTKADACLAGGAHGGDGVIDRGEDVTTQVTIRNTGTTALTHVTATLSTTLSGVTVTRAIASYPDIALGATATSNAPHFAWAVGPAVPCGSVVPFTLTIATDQGVFTDSFSLKVGAPGSATTSFPSTDVPKAIPDNSTTGVTSNVTVTGMSGAVTDVNVTVNVTHTWDGDITLTLVGPTGTQVTLSAKHGSSGDNYTNTVFDDSATTAIASGSPPYTGTFKPDSPLSALNGVTANGTWGLKVVDSASSDTGTITGWTLQLTAGSGDVCNDCAIVAPAAEVTGQAWTTPAAQQWLPVANASFYNVYRGTAATLADLVTPNPDSCLRLTTTATSTTTMAEAPAAGGAYWYLVRAANPGGEGPAGDATSGPRSHQGSGTCP